MSEFNDGRYKIILFNGPPRCGKDTAASLMQTVYQNSAHIEKFAKPLKMGVQAFYGLNDDQWAAWDSVELKDLPTEVFAGKTCRECQIAMSEVYAKPFHADKQVFGKLLVNRIKNWITDGLVFVSDSGFDEELLPLVETFGAGNIAVVRIERFGHSFQNDSRKYIYPQIHGLKTFDIDNNGDVQSLCGKLQEIVTPYNEDYQKWLTLNH